MSQQREHNVETLRVTRDRLRDSGQAAGEHARLAYDAAKDVLQATNSFVQSAMRERPFAAMGIAAGVGFVLAGGLGSALSRQLLRVGGKYLASQALSTGLLSLQSSMGTMVAHQTNNKEEDSYES